MPTSLVQDRPDRVQAVESAFELLEIIIDAGGEASLSELAAASELPPPALRRLLRTCLRTGCTHHLPSQRYGLGARLMRLGEGAV
jgi:IclR family acetate operon transcriptional repressor